MDLRCAPILALCCALPARAIVAQSSRPDLTARFGAFTTPQAPIVSPKGRWVAVEMRREGPPSDTTRWLEVHDREGMPVRRFPQATVDRFAPNDRWLVFRVNGDTASPGLAVLDLVRGTVDTVARATAAHFSPTLRYLTIATASANDSQPGGLQLLDLGARTTRDVAATLASSWTEDGELVALATAPTDQHPARLRLLRPRTGEFVEVDSGHAYSTLSWRPGRRDLLGLRRSPDGAPELVLWRGPGEGDAPSSTILRMVGGETSPTLAIADRQSLQWVDDGDALAFDARDRPEDVAPSAPPQESTVEIWHPRDVRLPPQQRRDLARQGAPTRRWLWRPDAGTLLPLSREAGEEVVILSGGRHAMITSSKGEEWGQMFGRPFVSVSRVDLRSGDRTVIWPRIRHTWASAHGRFLLAFDGTTYHAHELHTGITRQLGPGGSWADTAADVARDVDAPFGIGGWLPRDSAILLYDQYDVWRADPRSGAMRRLTDGGSQRIVSRVVARPNDPDAVAPRGVILLSLRSDSTAEHGYARIRGSRPPERLLWGGKNHWQESLADSSEILAFHEEARDDPADIVVVDAAARAPRPVQLTALDTLVRERPWTRARVIAYRTERGADRRATLLYPANHDPTRRYPMIVWVYERLTQETHYWEAPSRTDPFSMIRWTLEGYFVLLPDLRFTPGDPGVSALESLRPAVHAVVAAGLVDSRRVGIAGHSWGAYIATYAATHDSLFAAAVAHAPMTDLRSFMGQMHWREGVAETDHWETGQSRMVRPYWEDPAGHDRNSPIMRVAQLRTPLLLAHGDQDGAVEFFQSQILFNFARRAGTPVVLLKYAGEGHVLQQPANQQDFQQRLAEWFAHFLSGADATRWISDGIPVERLSSERRRAATSTPGPAGDGAPPAATPPPSAVHRTQSAPPAPDRESRRRG